MKQKFSEIFIARKLISLQHVELIAKVLHLMPWKLISSQDVLKLFMDGLLFIIISKFPVVIINSKKFAKVMTAPLMQRLAWIIWFTTKLEEPLPKLFGLKKKIPAIPKKNISDSKSIVNLNLKDQWQLLLKLMDLN